MSEISECASNFGWLWIVGGIVIGFFFGFGISGLFGLTGDDDDIRPHPKGIDIAEYRRAVTPVLVFDSGDDNDMSANAGQAQNCSEMKTGFDPDSSTARMVSDKCTVSLFHPYSNKLQRYDVSHLPNTCPGDYLYLVPAGDSNNVHAWVTDEDGRQVTRMLEPMILLFYSTCGVHPRGAHHD